MSKKMILTVVLVLLCSLLVFAGCQEQDPADQQPVIEWYRIVDKGATEFNVVNYLKDDAPAKSLAKTMRMMSGTDIQVVDESKAGNRAIYIGTAKQLGGKGGTSTDIPYTGYEFIMDENNIYIAIAAEEHAQAIVDAIKQQFKQIEDGAYGIDKAFAGTRNVANITEVIPVFDTVGGKLYDVHDSGCGNFLLTYNAVTDPGEPKEYEKKLTQNGYALYSENEIGDNRFAIYTKGDTMINCCYMGSLYEYRITYGPLGYLPSTTPVTEYEKVVTPSVSIIGQSDSVLNMVFQLADGSFIVIDGGWNKNGTNSITLNAGTANAKPISYARDADADIEALYNFLKDNTPNGGKPQVTWMITHADPDHITLPTRFFSDYADKFDLNMVVYNFPNFNNIQFGTGSSTQKPASYEAYSNGFVNAARQYFPEAKHLVYHTGQKLYLPGCEIEFLFTPPEDFYPTAMPWCNHTCGCWRVTIEGKTVMITGDIEAGPNTKMSRMYKEYLQSDVLQVVHHGANGGTLAFYRYIQPEICFWPVKDDFFYYDMRRLGTASGFDFNKYLRSIPGSRHYHGSITTTLLLPSLEEKK